MLTKYMNNKSLHHYKIITDASFPGTKAALKKEDGMGFGFGIVVLDNNNDVVLLASQAPQTPRNAFPASSVLAEIESMFFGLKLASLEIEQKGLSLDQIDVSIINDNQAAIDHVYKDTRRYAHDHLALIKQFHAIRILHYTMANSSYLKPGHLWWADTLSAEHSGRAKTSKDDNIRTKYNQIGQGFIGNNKSRAPTLLTPDVLSPPIERGSTDMANDIIDPNEDSEETGNEPSNTRKKIRGLDF